MFLVEKVLNGRISYPETEFIPVTPAVESNGTVTPKRYQKYQAIAIASGKAVIATGTTKPTHICLEDYTSETASDTHHIPCFVLSPDVILRTVFSAKPTSVLKGAAVTISANGDEVTATTTSGVATVVDLLGAAEIGDEVLVKIG